MFKSFFPNPKWFFISAAVWTVLCMALWYTVAKPMGGLIGLPPGEDDATIVGLNYFWSNSMLWFYLYYSIANAAFAIAWWLLGRNKWFVWSVLGSQFILFLTWYDVQVGVAIINWYGPFWDFMQGAMAKTAPATMPEFYDYIVIFLVICCIAVAVGAFNTFFLSHYAFRWRQAMNDFYTDHWTELRHIEGASQRVQEDTMRFASLTEKLAILFITAILSLVAYLPILVRLTTDVTELPFIGAVPHGVVSSAILWSLFGTIVLALIGIKLPGLNFKNQRVEAAYRKELVYGEDNPERADPPTLRQLFGNVRKNYFVLYFHYLYFNISRILFMQIDVIFPLVILGPTIIAGKITLGPLNQILSAFDKVRASFQYLITSWPDIVELMSIHKRLRSFEKAMAGEALPEIERQPDPA